MQGNFTLLKTFRIALKFEVVENIASSSSNLDLSLELTAFPILLSNNNTYIPCFS